MTTTHRSLAPFARLGAAFLTLAALLVAMVATSSPASAHARLEATSPKDGATLTAIPPEVMLRFNEPIKDGLNQITVKSGSTDAADGELQLEGNTLYQPLKSTLDPGDYTVTYKVVSADGHPVSGSLTFTYDPPEGDSGAAEPTTSGSSSSTSGSAAAPTSTSTSDTPTSSSTSSPAAESPSTSATDGESEPAAPEGTSTSASDEATADEPAETTDDDGTPAWVWIAGIGALLVILAGIGLLVRGRRDRGDDEDIHLEEWHD